MDLVAVIVFMFDSSVKLIPSTGFACSAYMIITSCCGNIITRKAFELQDKSAYEKFTL